MIDILFNKVSKNFGGNVVLDNISFDIHENDKVSLVGVNGSGKSTVLNLICGKENLSGGNISIRKNASIGILEQIPSLCDDDYKVSDYLNRGIKNILDLKDRLDYLENKLSSAKDDELDDIIMKYTKTQEKFISLGGYEVDSIIGKTTKIFKINDLLDRNFNDLSGERKQ